MRDKCVRLMLLPASPSPPHLTLGDKKEIHRQTVGEVEFNLKHAFGASTVHTSGGVYEYMCEAGGSCGWKVTRIGLLSHMTGIQVANCDLYLIIFKQRNRLQVLPPTSSGPSSSCEFILK